MARTMLNDNSKQNLHKTYLKKTLYELWKGQKPNISYFHPFGCKCFIPNTKDKLGNFDSKSDNRIFLKYSKTSKAFTIYNLRILVVKEAIHIRFDENKPDNDLSELDKPFVVLRLDDSSIATRSVRQNP